MRLEVQRSSTLPLLAWCAHVQSDVVLLRCGDAVETGSQFCFEGAWNGDFDKLGFDQATVCFGSGLLLESGRVVGVAPSHNVERLFSTFSSDQGWVVSNSFPFLLEEAGLHLDPGYIFYETDLDTMRLGIRRYAKSMPLLGGRRVNVHMCENFALESNGSLRRLHKVEPDLFDTFETYESFLLATARALLQNASADGRRVKYTPLTTISSGYDSTAISAIASDVGCREALTFVDARRFSDSSDDRGTVVAEHLELECTEYPRLGYREVIGEAGEAEFIVGGGEGQEIHYLAFEPHLRGGRALFTGCSAGRMWPVEKPAYDMTYLEMGDASSSSLVEFRLRLGFIYLPLGMAGFARAKDLIRIGASEQMRPWSIASPYNRPISRRIVESRGVPREAFGQSKKATSVLLRGEDAQVFLTPQSAAGISRHKCRTAKARLSRLAFNAACRARALAGRAAYLVDRAFSLFGLRTTFRYRNPVPEYYKYSLLDCGERYHWAMSTIRERYSRQSE